MVKICSIGGASQDVFMSGNDIKSHLDPIEHDYVESFKLGAKLDAENINFSTGGGATNAAVTFARQGFDSTFIGKLGKDIPAQSVIAELDNDNVDTHHIIQDESKGTQYSTILLTDSGERTILIYRGIANTHTPHDYESVDFTEYEWLYISSFGGAMDALESIINRASSIGVKIFFNPGKDELKKISKLKALLEDVDILSVNREEAQQIVEGNDLDELIHHLLHYVPLAIISDGPNGVIASDGKTVVRAGMYEDVKVIDRTGAGDAFGSGFLSHWSQGKSLKDSIVFASANSTSVVTKIGAKAGILHKGVVLHAMPLSESPF